MRPAFHFESSWKIQTPFIAFGCSKRKKKAGKIFAFEIFLFLIREHVWWKQSLLCSALMCSYFLVAGRGTTVRMVWSFQYGNHGSADDIGRAVFRPSVTALRRDPGCKLGPEHWADHLHSIWWVDARLVGTKIASHSFMKTVKDVIRIHLKDSGAIQSYLINVYYLIMRQSPVTHLRVVVKLSQW